MARVTLAKGGVWLRPAPKALTQASQTTLARYMHQVKTQPWLELRAYAASGALEVYNPRASQKPTPKGARLGNTLGACMGVAYTLNQKGNATPKASKVRAYVCHNMAKKKV